MTSLNNPVNLPLDTNGYVKSSIWGQNMNPNVNNVAGSVSGSVASVTGAVGSITNPPLRHKFMTNLITSTTSTTNVTLGTYTSSNGIGIVSINYYNSNAASTVYFSLNNGSTNLGNVQTTSANATNNYNSFAYTPQGAVTLSLEGYVNYNTGYYVVTVYEVF